MKKKSNILYDIIKRGISNKTISIHSNAELIDYQINIKTDTIIIKKEEIEITNKHINIIYTNFLRCI